MVETRRTRGRANQTHYQSMVEMFSLASIPFSLPPAELYQDRDGVAKVIEVGNSEDFGHKAFQGIYLFDQEGCLLAVGHYELFDSEIADWIPTNQRPQAASSED